jgi:L-serine/L-threonine ammonia-lyase
MSTDNMMISRIKAAGASEVIQHGATWIEADAHLRKEVMGRRTEEESVYCPPFDHPDIWAGVSSMVDEIQAQLPDGGKPDALICSVGGGGLLIGIMHGLKRVGWGDVSVLAMETKGADSLNASVQAGKLVTLPGITSIAKSLGAVRVAEEAFNVATDADLDVRSVVLSDAEACMACWRLADDHRLLVEPACGVSVAPCYIKGFLKSQLPTLNAESRVVVVLCGGSSATVDMLSQWKERFAMEVKAKSPA